nr:uncharacterized protein LOC109192662 [Ipomoea trifida]
MEQFHEIVRILGQIRQHGINMDDSIAIASIIDKLPPSWKKVHRSLMQRKEEITMEQLGAHLYVEEGIRQKESKNKGGARDTRASGSTINLFKKNGKGKGKAYVKCWVCNGPHFKKDCEVWKKRKAQMEGKSSGDHGQTDDSWWVDTGATRHVCKDINLYKVYKSLENGPSLYMGNDSMLEQRCGGDDGVRRRTAAAMSPADGEEKGSRRRLQLTAKKKVRRLHLQLRAKKKGDIWRRLFLRAELSSTDTEARTMKIRVNAFIILCPIKLMFSLLMASPDLQDSFAGVSYERTVSDVGVSTAHHFVSIKLIVHKYFFWRTQMVHFLQGQNLLGYVDGSIQCPTTTTAYWFTPSASNETGDTSNSIVVSVPSTATWIQQDPVILSILISSLYDLF